MTPVSYDIPSRTLSPVGGLPHENDGMFVVSLSLGPGGNINWCQQFALEEGAGKVD